MVLEEKDLVLQEMKRRLKEQEKEKQSELLKMQMEVVREATLYRSFLDETCLHKRPN